MSSPVSRYHPSRRYYFLLMLGAVGIAVSAWSGMHWPAAWFAALGFALPSVALLALVLQPSIEIHETHLKLGRRTIAWRDIRRLDRTGWNAPLVLRLTLGRDSGSQRLTLIYPGDLDGCRSLLRHMRRYSREALLDGVPYPKFWGEVARHSSAKHVTRESAPVAPEESVSRPTMTVGQLPPARHRLLLPEDEAEVERLFRRLKADGHLDSDVTPQGGGSPLASGSERSPEEK